MKIKQFIYAGFGVFLLVGTVNAENYKSTYCNNNDFVAAENKYPHLHCNKDFFVYSESKSNHKDMARGSDIYCDRTRAVIDDIKARGASKITGYQDVLNDTLSFARKHCKKQ